MARTKETMRRLPLVESGFTRRAIKPFKIKEILPQQKTVNIKKNGQIIKTINMRRKSRYFPGRKRLIF